MRIEAAIRGDLHKFMIGERAAAERAVTAGVTDVINSIKLDLRAQVVGAGLGNRLAKTWQATVYPRRGRKSISAAGIVSSKAPKIIRAFNDGAVIKSTHGYFLAVPTANAPKRVGNKRISPATYRGKLRFVYVNSRLSLLVEDAKRGATARAATVMFLLVPQVQLRKRLNYMTAVDKWAPQLPQSILRHWTDNHQT